LSARALGLDSCPMEGFDGRRLTYLLGADPDQYCIPLMVSIGYADSENGTGAGSEEEQRRFPLEDMFYAEEWGSPFNTPKK